MKKRIAVIDLGSNSIRLVIYGISDTGACKVINDISDSVRLIENMAENRQLSAASMEKALKTLQIFCELCVAYRIGIDSILAVATEAVRQAENRDVFLQSIQSATGINFRVLTGEEEAFYIYKAVVNSMSVPEGVIMDVGGGSAELIRFSGRHIVGCASIHLGAINATEKWLDKDEISMERLKLLERYLEDLMTKLDWIPGLSGGTLIGLGGTFRNLARMHRRRRDYPMELVHNYSFHVDDFHEIYDETKKLDLKQRKAIEGLSSTRADIIVGGLAIIKAALSVSGAKNIAVSGDGLRDGILREFIDSYCPYCRHGDVLEESIERNIEIYGLNKDHAYHVCGLACAMFDQMALFCSMGGEERKLLRTAALLHDIGLSVSYYGHPMHSSYILLNSRLNGLSHREMLIISAIVGSHGKNVLKNGWLKNYKSILDSEDGILVERLAMMLRLSECLDRSETGKIKHIDCHIGETAVNIVAYHIMDAELEIASARSNGCDFYKLFNKELLIA